MVMSCWALIRYDVIGMKVYVVRYVKEHFDCGMYIGFTDEIEGVYTDFDTADVRAKAVNGNIVEKELM